MSFEDDVTPTFNFWCAEFPHGRALFTVAVPDSHACIPEEQMNVRIAAAINNVVHKVPHLNIPPVSTSDNGVPEGLVLTLDTQKLVEADFVISEWDRYPECEGVRTTKFGSIFTCIHSVQIPGSS